MDGGNARIRKVGPDGTISTAIIANRTYDMAFNSSGEIFFIGTDRTTYQTSVTGTPVPFAGNRNYGFSGDNGPALNAEIGDVESLALDKNGNLYFTDGNRLRQVTTDGIIHTIAGGDSAVGAGDNGPAIDALLSGPKGLAIDGAGNIYIGSGCGVRKIDPAEAAGCRSHSTMSRK